jgi:hypothetical protein
MARANDKVAGNSYTTMAHKSLQVNPDGRVVYSVSWDKQIVGKGLSSDYIAINPVNGNMRLAKVRLYAPQVASTGVVKVYKTSTAAGNILYSGYYGNIYSDGYTISFPGGTTVTATCYVKASAAAGSTYYSFMYN